MKKTFTLFSLLIALVSSAQPVIQYANTPAAGMTATVYAGNKPTSAVSGAGVTWNFSTLTFTPLGTATIVTPASTPFASSFPSANSSAIIATPTSTFYTYDNVQPTFQDQIADNITATGGSTYTPDPKRHLVFPFNFGNSYTDTYQCISCSPGSFTVTYDSWGTLIVNGKTYSNVARITNMFGYPYYSYYNTNPVFPILSYDTSPSSGTTSILAESPSFTGIKENYMDLNMSVFPNPANEELHIQNNTFMKVEFEMYDLLGNKIKEKELLSQGQLSNINTINYPAGMYLIKFRDEFNNSTFRKVMIE
jgi:hypothetical protein